MTIKILVTCDACHVERQQTDNSKYIQLWDKSRFDLCDTCNKRLMTWLLTHTAPDSTKLLPFRGSVTDLATDVAFELQPSEGRELIDELERFLRSEPTKFKQPVE